MYSRTQWKLLYNSIVKIKEEKKKKIMLMVKLQTQTQNLLRAGWPEPLRGRRQGQVTGNDPGLERAGSAPSLTSYVTSDQILNSVSPNGMWQ